jgi:hypothetical protein
MYNAPSKPINIIRAITVDTRNPLADAINANERNKVEELLKAGSKLNTDDLNNAFVKLSTCSALIKHYQREFPSQQLNSYFL